MIDVSWPEVENGNGNHAEEAEDNGSEDEGHDSEGSIQEMTEFHVVPDEVGDVDEIYYVMTKFPAAEAMSDSDDENFFDGENIEQMNLNEDEDERFADAE